MTNLSTTLTYKLRKGEGRKWNNGRDSCHLCTWHGFFFCLDYDLPVFSFLLPEWGGWANHQRDWKFLYCWFYINNLFPDLIVLWRNRSIYSKTCLFTLDGVWLVALNSQLGKTSTEKKTFSFGHCSNEGGRGGVYPCPIFLAHFQEVHFWSIKRVYFFKNANVLNF